MDKKLYDLTVNDKFERLCPPLRDAEREVLEGSILANGCETPLIVWKGKGIIVDGHNRYRICQEHQIPFSYIETEFESVADAQKWIIRNQLARRNVPDYVRCELVLPFEEELKAQAKKRQIRKPQQSVKENFPEQKVGSQSRDELGKLAGVSGKTMMKAKKIAQDADEETKEKLRKPP